MPLLTPQQLFKNPQLAGSFITWDPWQRSATGWEATATLQFQGATSPCDVTLRCWKPVGGIRDPLLERSYHEAVVRGLLQCLWSSLQDPACHGA